MYWSFWRGEDSQLMLLATDLCFNPMLHVKYCQSFKHMKLWGERASLIFSTFMIVFITNQKNATKELNKLELLNPQVL
jgi:hypothetical protein